MRELLAGAVRHCPYCGGGKRDYCRTCDEFYWVHEDGCNAVRAIDKLHNGHRLTIVPFVEDRTL